MSLSEATMTAYGRRTVYDNVGAKADLELWNALNDATDMLAAAHRWPYFLRKAYLSLQTPYTTGSITMTTASAVVTGSGTTFPSWAASGNLFVGSQLFGVLTRDSATQLTLDATFGGDTASGQTYALFQDEYALAANIYQFKQILPGQAWGFGGDPVPIEQLWEVQNSTIVAQQFPSCFSIANNVLTVYPYPSANNSVAYSYYARPTPLTGSGSGTVDWPDTLRQVLNRAYDYQLCLRFGKCVQGDAEHCWNSYQRALAEAKSNDQSPRDLVSLMDSMESIGTRVPQWKSRAAY